MSAPRVLDHVGRMIGWTLLAGLAALIPPVGLVLVPYAFLRLAAAVAGLDAEDPRRRPRVAVAWLVGAVLLGALSAYAGHAVLRAVAGALFPPVVRTAGMLGWYAGPALLAAAAAPLCFVPLALVDPRRPGRGALSTSARLVGRGERRVLPPLLVGLAMLTVAPIGLAFAVDFRCVFGLLLVFPLGAWLIGSQYATRRALPEEPELDVAVPRAIRGMAAGAGALLVANLVALLGVFVLPGMQAIDYPMPMPAGTTPALVQGPAPVTIPGTPIRVDAAAGGVIVSGTPDAAGFVLGPTDERVASVRVDRHVGGDETRYDVFAYHGGAAGAHAQLTLDERGALLSARGLSDPGATLFVAGALGLALCLGLLALALIAGPLSEARQLREVVDADDLASQSRRRAFVGALEVSHGELRVRSARWLEVDADAHVRARGRRLRVPPGPLRWIAPAGTRVAPRADAQVTVIGRFERLVGGMREATVPWPKEPLLVVGGRQDAAMMLAERACGRAAPVLAATLVALLCSLVCLATML